MNKRLTVDLGMLISFLVLLDYRLVRNFGHETLALVFFLLFLLHTWFNRQWYASLTRGRWNTDRKLTFLADLLLLGSFAAVMASGLMISHTLPTGMQKAPLLAHQIHHVAGYVTGAPFVPGWKEEWDFLKSPIAPFSTKCLSCFSPPVAFTFPFTTAWEAGFFFSAFPMPEASP